MQIFGILLVAAAVFGVCYGVDRLFTGLFRSKAQHLSGLAVRASKRYGVFGVGLIVLGVMAMVLGVGSEKVLTYGGIIVALMGAGLSAYYLFTGIFYNGDAFLYSRMLKKGLEFTYDQILGQKLYLIQGGGIVIELHMQGGQVVNLQSSMDGVYPFLDTAFLGYCRSKGLDPQHCDFYDPSQSLWFPTVEDV